MFQHNPLDCYTTSTHSKMENVYELSKRKTLLDCLRENFARQRGQKQIDVHDLVKEMTSQLALSPEDYVCRNLESSNLNSKVFHLIF